jgi:hypothetical protein
MNFSRIWQVIGLTGPNMDGFFERRLHPLQNSADQCMVFGQRT